MAFYSNGLKNIDNQGIVDLRLYTSTSLPQSALAGYLAYVSDQQSLTVNTGDASVINGVSQLWKSFQQIPASYKNEVILAQGVVAGGRNDIIPLSPSVNYMSRILFSSDSAIQLQTTLPFDMHRGTSHCTWQYAYYHNGPDNQCAKQDWATFTVASIDARPGSNQFPTGGLNPGKKGQNTYGLIFYGIKYTLTFATETWSYSAFGSPITVSEDVASGENYGYAMSTGDQTVYKLNWDTGVWTGTSSGYGSANPYTRALNSKWNKWYQAGWNTAVMDVYSTANDTFSSAGAIAYPMFYEATVMGQDWGYWATPLNSVGGTDYSQSFKTQYSTDSTQMSSRTQLNYAVSAGTGTSGPI
jgi:hypothetical protein